MGQPIVIIMVIDPKTRRKLLLETKPQQRRSVPKGQTKKKPKVRDPHEFPGGRCEMGESYLEAAIREVREETGLGIMLLPKPIHSYSPTMRLYLGLTNEQEIELTDAHIGFGWYLTPYDVPLPKDRELPASYEGQFPPQSMIMEFEKADAALDKYLESLSS